MKDLLKTSEVARMLRVDITTVRRWITIGALEAVRLPFAGKRQGYRVNRKTLEKRLGTTLS